MKMKFNVILTSHLLILIVSSAALNLVVNEIPEDHCETPKWDVVSHQDCDCYCMKHGYLLGGECLEKKCDCKGEHKSKWPRPRRVRIEKFLNRLGYETKCS